MTRPSQLIFSVVALLALFHLCEAQQCTGGPHDIATSCGSQCPLTCENPEPQACIFSCKLNTCECAPNYVRRSDGQCVTPSECNQGS